MAGLVGYDAGPQETAAEPQVSQQVQHLVAGTFVREMQTEVVKIAFGGY